MREQRASSSARRSGVGSGGSKKPSARAGAADAAKARRGRRRVSFIFADVADFV